MSTTLKVLFFLCDLIFLNISVGMSLWVHDEQFGTAGLYLLVYSNISWLFLVMASNPYNVTKGWTLSKILKTQLSFVFIHLLVVIALIFFYRQQYSILGILLIYLFFVPLFFLSKVVTFYMRRVFSRDLTIKNFIILGRNELSERLRKFYLTNPSEGRRFVGYLDMEPGMVSIEKIQHFCERQEVHEVYCCIPSVNRNDLQNLIGYGLDSLIKVIVVAETDFATGRMITMDESDAMPGVNMATIPLDETRNQFLKRVFDLFFSSLFGLLVMSWLFPIIALAVKLDSPGPVFFVQLRSGKGNRPFKCLKFRTMVVNAQADTVQASRSDPRITPLGQFLRKTSIDELPQFLNVLGGSMSVVGPRPHMLKHTEEYSQLIERFMGRHYVKPGITGLAQCLGYRGETRNLSDMENRVRMDRYYIENWTFWLDIKIIFLTVISLIRGSDKAF